MTDNQQSTASDPASAAHPFNDLRTASGTVRRGGGAHRMPAPPTALKGRAAVVAVAAGAAAAAGHTVTQDTSADTTSADQIALAAGTSVQLPDGLELPGLTETDDSGATVVVLPDLADPQEIGEFADQVAKGAEAELQRALNVPRPGAIAKPTSGVLTSPYGARWGTIHGGLDIANSTGTPIHTVADGEVIDAGPAAGFGQWVRVRHDDGTVTVYGHVETIDVSVGQRVAAGQQIATMGSRGFSTGPHLHFEVWENNGTDRVDPQPWLAARGIDANSLAH